MQYTRESAIERLLKNYEPFYDIHMMINGDRSPITARCDFFEHSGQYVISKKAELWSAENEEFLYLVNIPHLTLETFEELKSEIHADGMKRIHEDARKALKKCRIYKSFHFSLHGWMNFHAALVEVADGKVTSNASGHHVAKILKKVLYDTRGKRS